MNLKKNGVDYDAFLQRMMGKEALVSHDFEKVDFKAHTLKGIARNLDFEKLGNLCMNILISVHSGDTSKLELQFEQIKDEYTYIIEVLGN